MLNIKTFRDGDRLVVVFEGLKDLPSEEELIQSYLGSIAGATVSKESPVEANPVPQQDEEPPVIPDREADVRHVFAEGEYEGLTPEEVLAKGKAKGFTFLAKQMHNKNLSEAMRSEIMNTVKEYLKNFKNCEPVAYSKKLTWEQIQAFYKQYDAVLPKKVKETVYQDGKLLGKQFEINLRIGIADAIKHFKTI